MYVDATIKLNRIVNEQNKSFIHNSMIPNITRIFKLT